MVPLSFNSADQKVFAEADVRNGSRRRRLFGEAYGISLGREFFDMVEEVLAFMGNESEMRHIVGDAAAVKLKAEGHLAHWQSEAQLFHSNRARIEANFPA